MECIDLAEKLALVRDLWSPRIVAEVNDVEVKIARIRGAFDWHQHADSDEMFLVLDGRMTLEFRGSTVELERGQMCVVPRGTEHRPVAGGDECCILLVEPKGTRNTGEDVTARTVDPERI